MLRRGLFILILSLQAHAGQFDFAPSALREQMNAGNFKRALGTWNSSVAQTDFAQTQNGKATLAFLMFQNGLPLAGLDLLMTTNPRNLNAQLLTVWKAELKKSDFIQKGWMRTTGSWKSVYNNETVGLQIKNAKDIQRAFNLANALPKDNVNEKARVWWRIATRAPQIDQLDPALRALKLMRESGQTAVGQDQVSSAYARILYQKGDLDAATAAFLEIPKSSSLWIESVEERAWTSLRKSDYDKALGETVTLLSPALAPLVGPESYYLANLISLKVCDYPRIFKNSETFKKRHAERLEAMQELSKTGMNKNLMALFERLDQKGVTIEGAGPLVSWIPRAAYRDHAFLSAMESRRQWLAESKKAESLGLTVDGSKITEQLKQNALKRVRVLAGEELKEYRQNLNRMHIIEGEVIQRLAVDESLKGERSKLAKVEDQGDVLIFPYKSDEVWLDELDNYKARVKDCPSLKGASL